MKNLSKVTWIALGALTLFALGACSGKHEEQGKNIGKKIDNLEAGAKKKFEQSKETAHNTKEKVENKARDLHENAKEKAHELINKS